MKELAECDSTSLLGQKYFFMYKRWQAKIKGVEGKVGMGRMFQRMLPYLNAIFNKTHKIKNFVPFTLYITLLYLSKII